MSELAYCPYCRRMVLFDTREELRSTELDGVLYEYQESQAICRECGSDEAVYQPYMEAAGLAFNEAVRKANGLVPLSKVRELPKKYRIGKRPLSLLLGWGELTYTRFFEGHTPSRSYSDTIERLYDDPAAYYRVLVRNKDRITDVAFRKSEQAVQSLLEDSFSGTKKLYEVADYFCELSEGDITPLMLQKLTYYAHGFSYVFLDTPLLDQMPDVLHNEPIYEQIWHDFKERDYNEVFASVGVSFSEDEDQLIKAVFESFGKYSGMVLSRMVQSESPLTEADDVPESSPDAISRTKVSAEAMKVFFREQAEKLGMKSSHDIARYAEAAFSRVCSAGPWSSAVGS